MAFYDFLLAKQLSDSKCPSVLCKTAIQEVRLIFFMNMLFSNEHQLYILSVGLLVILQSYFYKGQRFYFIFLMFFFLVL